MTTPRFYYEKDYRAGVGYRNDYAEAYDIRDRRQPTRKIGVLHSRCAAQVLVDALNAREG